jgi:hypothetical protein
MFLLFAAALLIAGSEAKFMGLKPQPVEEHKPSGRVNIHYSDLWHPARVHDRYERERERERERGWMCCA